MVAAKHRSVLKDMALRKQLANLAIPLDDVTPEAALLHMVAEAAGNVAFLGARVAELSVADSDTAGVPATAGQFGRSTRKLGVGEGLYGPKIGLDKDGGEHVIGEELRAVTQLYGEWSDRLVKYAKVALDAGIAKAQVEIAKSQGQTLVIIINRVFAQMGLEEGQAERARVLLAEEFRSQSAKPVGLEGAVVR